MKKRYLLLLVACVALWSCEENQAIPEDNTQVVVNTQVEDPEPPVPSSTEEDPVTYGFMDGDEAAQILAADDDYTVKLSLFDYASKYGSEVALDADGRKSVIAGYTLDWTDQQKAVIKQHMERIQPKIDALNMDMPEVYFALTTSQDEGGAAGYTRQNLIVLKPAQVNSYNPGVESLIIHEMFHVYSRYHKDLRDDMYAVINYMPCEELVMPEALKDLTISNPDAPDNNYFIEGTYQGQVYQFIPVLYSNEPFDLTVGGSFFSYLNDDLLAVEIIDGVPRPIYEEGVPLIVSKEEVVDYYDKIGLNTHYTFHPEETMADNFVFLVMNQEVPSPWVVEGLKNVISN